MINNQSFVIQARPKNWINILFLSLSPVMAVVSLVAYIVLYGWSWKFFIFACLMFAIFNLSITAGYHRYFSHRSFEAHPILEFLFIFLGSGAFQGSVLEWCYDHRKHHLKIDTNEDPYNIHNGFWYAHFFWMFYKNKENSKYPKDLAHNEFLIVQHRYYGFFAVLSGFFFPAFLGWVFLDSFLGGLIWGGIVRVVFTQHSTFLVNSVAHTFGSQPYNTQNTARDSLLVALLTFGEGYHNFHHHFQSDYRCAVYWYQWDPTKWMIHVLRYFRLVGKLRFFSEHEILIARMNADFSLAKEKGLLDLNMEGIKKRAEEAQIKLKAMIADYEKKKDAFKTQSKSQYRILKAELRVARLEFYNAYTQWKVYFKAVRV